MAVKMAIIGMGGMAGWHYKNVTESVPEIQIVGAYDIREEAKKGIDDLGIINYKNPEAIYEDKDIDVVLIATPNDMHKPYAIACLEAGKHVLCEKPVTLNTAEFEEIVAVANRVGKLFTVHQNRRWDSDYLTVRKIINEKILNGLYRIESRVQGSRQWVHGWRGYKVNGGGMVLDWGIHLLDQMLDLFPGKVKSVHAHFHQIVMPEVEDDFTASLLFDNGVSAIVNVSMSSFIVQPRWHLFAQDGSAQIHDWDCGGEIIKLSNADELEWAEDIVYTSAGPTRSMAPRPKSTVETLPLPVVKGDWLDLHRNLVQVIAGKAEPIVTHAQARRCMQVVDAIFESARTGASVTCDI
ncbi:MAG: Gfo/Idh/MocA family oxidoreductase [Defluviitaleaceae bacterium]|nr:Gfo/Idh/MocA family oxidoreductase [Defluviitaleaceae bacterium]